jgi:quercetin dioxygenase-like cupin family protein
MRIVKGIDRIGGDARPPNGKFHGHALQHTLHETAEETRGSFVRFQPGAYTHWHQHSGGQLIHIVEGSARIQAWGEPEHSLQAGDTAIAPAGEKHWHGASANTAMTQLAVTSGEVIWLEDAHPEG